MGLAERVYGQRVEDPVESTGRSANCGSVERESGELVAMVSIIEKSFVV